MAKRCKNYTGVSCIDGTCPNAQYESADQRFGYGIAEDMGLEKIKCKDCYLYRGCEDCYNNSPEDNRICPDIGRYK